MSVAIRRALYGKMAGDTTLMNMLNDPAPGFGKALYHQLAPPEAKFPYVVFAKQSGVPAYSMAARDYDNDLWLVKGVDRQVEGADADPVDAIAARLDALLTDGSLSISGRRQLYFRRESDVEYVDLHGDEIFLHAGVLFRLLYE